MHPHDVKVATYPATEWRSTLRYGWWCSTCDLSGPALFESGELARISQMKHRWPDQDPPSHICTVTPDELGTFHWTCTCGSESQPRGHRQEPRARQSHTRHTQQSVLEFYEQFERAELNRLAKLQEARDRWAHLTPKGRERDTKKYLEEIL